MEWSHRVEWFLEFLRSEDDFLVTLDSHLGEPDGNMLGDNPLSAKKKCI